ncbi:class I SAM-dependent methyltransferase [Levilinea saccharolytica]|nr:class I SAM-dependent methyltransferase [Levilinea saccharolytica]
MNRRLGSSAVQHLRRKTLSGVYGEILEIGFGSGLNLDCYPAQVCSINAVDVLPLRLFSAAPKIRVCYQIMSAENLNFPDASFDSVVSTFTLCSIPNVGAALKEIARVLKPQGTLFFLEHGKSQSQIIAMLQKLLNPLYNLLACGCNVNRDVLKLIAESGLTLQSFQQQQYGFPISGFYFSGSAIKEGNP